MSRIKRFAHSMASGYVLIAVNMVYTLAMLPLALNYLTAVEFGLWTGIAAIAAQLQLLVDFGMSGSVSRILVDHKDDRASNSYGAVIKTGFLALVAQGTLVAIMGSIVSFWLPQLLKNVPAELWSTCRWLMIGQCTLLGLAFAGRIFNFVLQAHQRYDASNYAQVIGFAVGLLALWIAFECNLGLYSMLVSAAAFFACTNLCFWLVVLRTKLLPQTGHWGKADWAMFRSIFAYANEIFMLSVGQVLIGISQVPIITWTLGLEAVAVWTTMTKTFMLAQQLITRMFDFSSAAFAEMMVRKEKARLQERFRDVTTLTASCAVMVCLAVALCNDSFVQLWMKGRFSWSIENDVLMAVFVIVCTITRCHIGLAGLTKDIRGLKYVYLVEGLLFVVLSLALSPGLGLTGVILGGIVSNLICSGWYGVQRTVNYFGVSMGEVAFGWLKRSGQLFWVLLAVAAGLWYGTRMLSPFLRLTVDGLVIGILGLVCFWRIGLTIPMRTEAVALLSKWRNRRFQPENVTTG
jgi:O-antigen/teichoic acid export membrane protein